MRTRNAIGHSSHFANSPDRAARRLYPDDAFAVDLDNSVYPLDTTTIDLSLKVFPWAHFRTTKAAVKMHTLSSDARCNTPADLVSAGSRPQGVLPCAAIRICQMTKENRLVC